jgi:ATP-dependent protease HslVU (ClpYQ) peptidase subunit
MLTYPKETSVLLQKYIERIQKIFRARSIIGFVGTVSANLFILAAVEHLTSVARLSLA